MPKSTLQESLETAIKKAEPSFPWSLLPKRTASDPKYTYPLRVNSLQPVVYRYSPVLEAAALYSSGNEHNNIPFRMVQQQYSMHETIVLEAGMPDGTSFLVTASNQSVRISVVEEDGTHSPCLPFSRMDSSALRLIVLAMLPHILAIDRQKGNGKLEQAVTALGSGLDAANGGSAWKTVTDIPQTVQDAAFYLDAVMSAILSDEMEIDFGSDASVPAEVTTDRFLNPTAYLSGTLICEDLQNGWTPKLVEVVVNHRASSARSMTIGEAKAYYAFFSAHCTWNDEEKKLIPEFPEDMPVMPEVLRMLRRIVNTHDDVNPVCNVMWRGETGYGKSTGTRQLACILQRPFLTLTAHSRTEAEDFKSTIIPECAPAPAASKQDDIEMIISVPYAPYVRLALEHIRTMAHADVKAKILNSPYFFPLLHSSPATASDLLFGREVSLQVDEISCVYSEVTHQIRSEGLQKQLKEATVKSSDQRFLHVQSPYMKAMTRGYIVEIQEVSRIKDSGVIVSINEFNRPGATMQLSNGEVVTRHQDALCISTDNVGYVANRPLEQSFIRRNTMIIDSTADSMSKAQIFERLTRNTRVSDNDTLEFAYKIWSTIRDYCNHNDISFGSVSLSELEGFVQALRDEGTVFIEEVIHDCIIASATSDIGEQREIWAVCRDILGVA